MKLLLITHSYPPHVSPRAIRWSAIAENLASRGHEITTIAAWFPGLPRTERLRNVAVERVGSGPAFVRLRQLLASHRAGQGGAPAPVSKGTVSPTGLAARVARVAYDALWRSVYWPDYAALWYRHATRRARELARTGEFDALITSSLPFTDHLVGLGVRRAVPSIPWLADSGDPFYLTHAQPVNNNLLYDRLNFRAERAVMRACDSATVTTPQTADMYRDAFPEAAHKVSVIPPLFAASASRSATDGSGTGPRRLVFVGTLYRKIRSPAVLLDAFARLAARSPHRWELHVYGALHDTADIFTPYARQLGDRLVVHGIVGREQALAAQESAYALVNIGNDTPHQLPSKVVEYASTGRPIVNFARSSEDSSVELLATYPSAHPVVATERLAEEQLLALEAFLDRPPAVDAGVLDRWLSQFRAETIAVQYEQTLMRIVTARKGERLAHR